MRDRHSAVFAGSPWRGRLLTLVAALIGAARRATVAAAAAIVGDRIRRGIRA